jgi:hypothetical protein
MKRVLLSVSWIANAFRVKTVFTRFIPPQRVEEAGGLTGGESDVCVLAAFWTQSTWGTGSSSYPMLCAAFPIRPMNNLLQLFSERFHQQIEVASADVI